MEFDMVGIDASITNAFRRILLAEVRGFGSTNWKNQDVSDHVYECKLINFTEK